MAIKASALITLSSVTDVASVTRYYLLQSSTLLPPSKPTTNPPGGSWSDAEPAYTTGSTNSLYFTDLTVFSDGTWIYSSVSLSSSYEAAKAAYNKADAAQSTANTAEATANAAQQTADRKVTTYMQPEAPAEGMSEGDIWFDTSCYNTEYRYNGSMWVRANEVKRVVRIDTAGLHVGEDTQGSTEVLIKSDSVNIGRAGSADPYSTFAGSYVQFGNYQMRRSADGGLVFKLTSRQEG